MHDFILDNLGETELWAIYCGLLSVCRYLLWDTIEVALCALYRGSNRIRILKGASRWIIYVGMWVKMWWKNKEPKMSVQQIKQRRDAIRMSGHGSLDQMEKKQQSMRHQRKWHQWVTKFNCHLFGLWLCQWCIHLSLARLLYRQSVWYYWSVYTVFLFRNSMEVLFNYCRMI